jgi:hypothetical protein
LDFLAETKYKTQINQTYSVLFKNSQIATAHRLFNQTEIRPEVSDKELDELYFSLTQSDEKKELGQNLADFSALLEMTRRPSDEIANKILENSVVDRSLELCPEDIIEILEKTGIQLSLDFYKLVFTKVIFPFLQDERAIDSLIGL